MKLPKLKIGNLIADVPIIQGAMGVGVSRSKLASAVANVGGIGVIAGVQIGYEEEDFETDNDSANLRGLVKEIRKARELSPNGILGVNILSAVNNYKDMVKAAVKEKIDLIISGAGLPKNLPGMIKGSNTKIAPIVSSGRAASVISRLWTRKFDYLPDAIIVEGPKAGGHLGFTKAELELNPVADLKDLVRDVLEAVRPFSDKYKKEIPIIAAGGIFDGCDIAEYLRMGASGVQMATRFVATEECDADINFKKAYIDATKEDIQLVKSPVGMPGRAIRNSLVASLERGNLPVAKCYNCLKPCDPADTPYCISEALIRSVKGDIDKGLIFVGENGYRLTEITTVPKLIKELVDETKECLELDECLTKEVVFT